MPYSLPTAEGPIISKKKELRWGFIKTSTKFAEKRQEEWNTI